MIIAADKNHYCYVGVSDTCFLVYKKALSFLFDRETLLQQLHHTVSLLCMICLEALGSRIDTESVMIRASRKCGSAYLISHVLLHILHSTVWQSVIRTAKSTSGQFGLSTIHFSSQSNQLFFLVTLVCPRHSTQEVFPLSSY